MRFAPLLILALFTAPPSFADMSTITTGGTTWGPEAEKINANFTEHEGEITTLQGDISVAPFDSTDLYLSNSLVSYGGIIYRANVTIDPGEGNPDVNADWVNISSTGAAVDSVNGETGTVVLDPDDLDDSATTNKFTTAAEAARLAAMEDGATADQVAADLPVTPAGNIAATDGQSAFEELDTEKAPTDNISFVMSALSDWLIQDTAEPANGSQVVDDTVDYGEADDDLHLNSVERTGILLDLKQDADADLTTAAGASAASNDTYFGKNASGTVGFHTIGGGTISATEQASDPSAGSMSTGDLSVATASGDMFYTTATGMYTIPGTYAVDGVTRTVTFLSPTNGDITCSDSDLSTAIDCPDTNCTATVDDGAVLTAITATADTGYDFDSWAGGVSGAWNAGTITVSADETDLGASFAEEVTDCGNLGTWDLYYDVDHSSGTYVACVSGGTETGTAGNSPASSTQNHTSAGTYSVESAASGNYYVSFTEAAITGEEGYISLWTYPTSLTSDYGMFDAWYDSDNRIVVFWDASQSQVRLYRDVGGTLDWVGSSSAITTGSWQQVEVRWDEVADTMSVRIDGGSWSTPTTSLETWGANALDEFNVGERRGNYDGGAGYVDDVYLSTDYAGGS